MSIKEALNYLDYLLSDSSRKSEIKVYQEFIEILNGVKQRDLSATEIQAIEAELQALELKSTEANKARYFKKALRRFIKFLKEEFSLTPKEYYTKLGIALGASFGVLVGIVFLSSLERSMGIALGISIGMLVGLLVGKTMDSQAKASGKMV